MKQVLVDMVMDGHASGIRGVLFWARAILDIGRHALAERVAETRKRRNQEPRTPRRRLESVFQDIIYGIRGLLRQPSFSLAVIVTLALGIGATTAIFSVINGVLIQPLPYQQDRQLMQVEQHRDGSPGTGFSPMEFDELRAKTVAFEELVEYHSLNFTLLGRGEPARVRSGVVSWQFFQMLGVQPAAGRLFLEDDDIANSDPVLLLSYRFWQDHFGGDLNVIGEAVRMNDKVHTVVGILPPFPHHPRDNDVYMPTVACPFRPGWIPNRQARGLSHVFGRLKEGSTEGQAISDLASIGHDMRADAPEAYPDIVGSHRLTPVPLKAQLTQGARPTLLVLLGTVSLVLLISCANVANLMWARLFHRRRELALRSALGASRGRLTRQLATESTVISLVGGALGLVIAFAGHGLLVDFTARLTPRAREVEIDMTVMLFALLLSVGTGLIFGTVRPPRATSGLSQTLRDSGERSVGGGGLLRHGLVVVQIALSFILLVSAGLSIRSFARLSGVDDGVNGENVLTMTLAAAFGNDVKPLAFTESVIREVSAYPGVRSVALTSSFPLDQVTPFSNVFTIEGRELGDSTQQNQSGFRVVTPDYFETVGQPILLGRTFHNSERGQETPPVALVNRAFAVRFFGNGEPIGKRIGVNFLTQEWIEIVGVMADTRQSLQGELEPEIYFNKLQFPSAFNRLLVRTVADPMALAEPIRSIILGLAPDVPVADVRTLSDVRRSSIASPRTTTVLLTLFALIALIISATGTAGVIGFAVTRRTNEIGLRMALGADKDRVLGMFVKQGLTMLGVGLGIGVIGAVVFSKVASTLLFGITATDPTTYVIVGTVLASVAVAATIIPARRAAAVDPLTALRTD